MQLSLTLPERDSWESRDGGNLLDDGFPVSVDLIIDYVDGEGQTSHRRITTKRVVGWGHADAMVDAHCHERDAHRSFRVSRMQRVVAAETGEIIADPAAYLRQRYESSPAGLATAVMERENVALVVLMYVARCTTNLTKPRRDPVLAYLAGRIDAPDPTAVLEALDQGIREYRPTRRDFDGALKALKVAPQDVRQAVVTQARAIAASRKKTDPIEQATVEMVVQVLADQ